MWGLEWVIGVVSVDMTMVMTMVVSMAVTMAVSMDVTMVVSVVVVPMVGSVDILASVLIGAMVETVVVSMDVVSMDVTMTVAMAVTMVGSVVDLRHELIHRGADDVVDGVEGDATFWAAFPLAEAKIVGF